MTTAGNGTPVTWRELGLALEPLHERIEALDRDVRLLLDHLASTRAVAGYRRWMAATMIAAAAAAAAITTTLAAFVIH